MSKKNHANYDRHTFIGLYFQNLHKNVQIKLQPLKLENKRETNQSTRTKPNRTNQTFLSRVRTGNPMIAKYFTGNYRI